MFPAIGPVVQSAVSENPDGVPHSVVVNNQPAVAEDDVRTAARGDVVYALTSENDQGQAGCRGVHRVVVRRRRIGCLGVELPAVGTLRVEDEESIRRCIEGDGHCIVAKARVEGRNGFHVHRYGIQTCTRHRYGVRAETAPEGDAA